MFALIKRLFSKEKDNSLKLIVAENNMALVISTLISAYSILIAKTVSWFLEKDTFLHILARVVIIFSATAILFIILVVVYHLSKKNKKEVLEEQRKEKMEQYAVIYSEIKELREMIENLNNCANKQNCINKINTAKMSNLTGVDLQQVPESNNL